MFRRTAADNADAYGADVIGPFLYIGHVKYVAEMVQPDNLVRLIEIGGLFGKVGSHAEAKTLRLDVRISAFDVIHNEVSFAGLIGLFLQVLRLSFKDKAADMLSASSFRLNPLTMGVQVPFAWG